MTIPFEQSGARESTRVRAATRIRQPSVRQGRGFRRMWAIAKAYAVVGWGNSAEEAGSEDSYLVSRAGLVDADIRVWCDADIRVSWQHAAGGARSRGDTPYH